MPGAGEGSGKVARPQGRRVSGGTPLVLGSFSRRDRDENRGR